MMKISRLIIGFVFILMMATFALAQAEKPQSASANKIVAINSKALEDEKNGVADFIEIYKKLDAEFAPQTEELKAMFEKMSKLQKEFEELNERCNKAFHCSEKMAEEALSKLEEHKLLSDKFKTEKETAQAFFDKRKAELSVEVNKKITVALNRFAKEKGFTLILDSRMNNLLIETNENFIDITNDFIKFYNKSFGKVKKQ
jgi:Skp family chaperone for outer membrane proteins